MTPEQKTLARQALGLPNPENKSFRNHYFSGREHQDWGAMVAAGEAASEPARNSVVVGYTRFYLTRAGAELALEEGETLDGEHFPP